MGAVYGFSSPKLRSDFKSEVTRVLRAIKECDELDKMLGDAIEDFMVDRRDGSGRKRISPQRGAGGLMTRLIEQRISNRNQKTHLIDMLIKIKAGILDREFRIAKATIEAEAPSETSVTAEVLRMIQNALAGTNYTTSLLEPGEMAGAEVNELIRARLAGPVIEGEAEEAAPPPALPGDPEPGDVVCDTSGDLWVLRDDGGVDPAVARAEELFLQSADPSVPPYARLEDGRHVLVFDLSEVPTRPQGA